MNTPRTLAALALCVVACSDDAASSEGSGVAGDKKLTSLTHDESAKVCYWLPTNVPSAEADCLPDAVLLSPDKTTCESELSACMASHAARAEQSRKSQVANCDEGEVTSSPECTATVAQLESCVRDTIAARNAYAKKLSCDRVMQDLPEYKDPASCAAVEGGNCYP